MTGALRVTATAQTAQPGDDAIVIDPATEDGHARPSAGILVSEVVRDLSGVAVVEVVVDGWRFELAVEDEARAELRRRATRDRDAASTSGPTDVRAMIPGRVAAVRVSAGDAVAAGEGLLVVEAMKMQNELRAARDGTVERVAVAVGDTIELGDLLVVLR